jgi:predicted transcriptional regulator
MVSSLRFTAAKELVEHYGVSLAEAARVLGVTTSAISKMLQKRKDNY